MNQFAFIVTMTVVLVQKHSSDLSGNRKPEIHFIAADTELKVDNDDIKLQIDDSDSGRKWISHLKI